MKKLMLGNEAVARGAYEAGVTVATAYPGTPSTEITENIARYDEIYAEWSPNEKVAMEVAYGAAVAGARSIVSMKHVGLNVAADPLFSAAYAGVNGGMVIVVADDPAMHSSQNEQDSRYYAVSAHVPMLEPSDSEEAKEFVKEAFALSEKYDTPVFLRTTTRLAHSQSFVELCDRADVSVKKYEKDITKYTLMPSTAKIRHIAVEKRENELKREIENSPLNFIREGDKKIGVVTSGVVYQYVREALPDASVFKLGCVYPLPVEKIRKFAESVGKLIVVEELEPVIENALKANGIPCDGKKYFGVQGELSVGRIKTALSGESFSDKNNVVNVPVRPPVMCAGCPHRGVFYALKKLGCRVISDIGCYTLGAQSPLYAVDTVLCMGASLGMAQGFEHALGRENTKNVVAVIGDSTFIHSGITGLIDAVYNKTALTLVILDNSTTGMTGHQEHPATGKTIKGEDTYALNLEDAVKASGVNFVETVDAYDMKAVEKAIKEACSYDGVSVVIAKRPCALKIRLAEKPYEIRDCKKCGKCLKIGCPAIQKNPDGSACIRHELCVGCGVCRDMCAFGAIVKE